MSSPLGSWHLLIEPMSRDGCLHTLWQKAKKEGNPMAIPFPPGPPEQFQQRPGFDFFNLPARVARLEQEVNVLQRTVNQLEREVDRLSRRLTRCCQRFGFVDED